MHLQTTATLLLTAALASTAFAACGEKAKLVCFGVDGGTSQGINLDDLQYVADALRFQTEENPTAMWAMPGGGFDCAEWTLPVEGAGTVLALTKHINPRINSSVLYTDIANTIDGGANASDKDKKESLMGACGANGGMVGVKVDTANPAYNSADYKNSKAKPEGIIIKIVKAP